MVYTTASYLIHGYILTKEIYKSIMSKLGENSEERYGIKMKETDYLITEYHADKTRKPIYAVCLKQTLIQSDKQSGISLLKLEPKSSSL